MRTIRASEVGSFHPKSRRHVSIKPMSIIALIAGASVVILSFMGYLFDLIDLSDESGENGLVHRNSIAILPFVDLSQGKDQEG